MLVESLMIAGVVVLPLPALVVGVRGVDRRRGLAASDQTSFVLLVVLRVLCLLLVLALTGVILLSTIGAIIRDLELPTLLYTFFAVDLLFAALILLTFGRSDRRPARRRATPAAR